MSETTVHLNPDRAAEALERTSKNPRTWFFNARFQRLNVCTLLEDRARLQDDRERLRIEVQGLRDRIRDFSLTNE